jgi:RNA polymerase sigma-70 factor (ECF subfamily)
MSSRTVRLLDTSSAAATRETPASDCAPGHELPLPAAGRSFLQRLKLRLKNDEELVAALQKNEPDALTVLFTRHSPLVFRIARRILRNDSEAEDAVQQVFLDVFRSAAQFDPAKGTFKVWLMMFAYHRTFNRRRQLLARGYYDSGSVEDLLPHELLQGARRPFPFSAAETAVLVDQALKSIQPRQRRAIELIYYEGLTAEEAAGVTGESVRVMRHNLYRGLEKLRAVLCSNAAGEPKNQGKPPERSRT